MKNSKKKEKGSRNGVNKWKKMEVKKEQGEGRIEEENKQGGEKTETREKIEGSFHHRTPENRDKSQLAVSCRLNLSPWF